MDVAVAGHTASSKTLHAIRGEWSYTSQNVAKCGVKLTGNDTMRHSYITITCGNCLRTKQTAPVSDTDTQKTDDEFTTEIDDLRVTVNKVGGGTVGRKYTGDWTERVERLDGSFVSEGVFTSGTPWTHEMVAMEVAEYVGWYGEDA